MQFPDTEQTRQTEAVMSALCAADVLKFDEPNHPTHCNRAFSAVYEALEPTEPVERAESPTAQIVRDKGNRNLDYLRRKGLI